MAQGHQRIKRGVHSWDDHKGVGWQLWKRTHAMGLLQRGIRRQSARIATSLFDPVPLATVIQRRFGVGEASKDNGFRTFQPIFLKRMGINTRLVVRRGSTSATPKVQRSNLVNILNPAVSDRLEFKNNMQDCSKGQQRRSFEENFSTAKSIQRLQDASIDTQCKIGRPKKADDITYKGRGTDTVDGISSSSTKLSATISMAGLKVVPKRASPASLGGEYQTISSSVTSNLGDTLSLQRKTQAVDQDRIPITKIPFNERIPTPDLAHSLIHRRHISRLHMADQQDSSGNSRKLSIGLGNDNKQLKTRKSEPGLEPYITPEMKPQPLVAQHSTMHGVRTASRINRAILPIVSTNVSNTSMSRSKHTTSKESTLQHAMEYNTPRHHGSDTPVTRLDKINKTSLTGSTQLVWGKQNIGESILYPNGGELNLINMRPSRRTETDRIPRNGLFSRNILTKMGISEDKLARKIQRHDASDSVMNKVGWNARHAENICASLRARDLMRTINTGESVDKKVYADAQSGTRLPNTVYSKQHHLNLLQTTTIKSALEVNPTRTAERRSEPEMQRFVQKITKLPNIAPVLNTLDRSKSVQNSFLLARPPTLFQKKTEFSNLANTANDSQQFLLRATRHTSPISQVVSAKVPTVSVSSRKFAITSDQIPLFISPRSDKPPPVSSVQKAEEPGTVFKTHTQEMPLVSTNRNINQADIPISTHIDGQRTTINMDSLSGTTESNANEFSTHANVGNESLNDNPDTAVTPNQIDIDEIVDKAWKKLLGKLTIEQERRGLMKWV